MFEMTKWTFFFLPPNKISELITKKSMAKGYAEKISVELLVYFVSYYMLYDNHLF